MDDQGISPNPLQVGGLLGGHRVLGPILDRHVDHRRVAFDLNLRFGLAFLALSLVGHLE
jgi:hypothetical protein